jgi:hypothetical protein
LSVKELAVRFSLRLTAILGSSFRQLCAVENSEANSAPKGGSFILSQNQNVTKNVFAHGFCGRALLWEKSWEA